MSTKPHIDNFINEHCDNCIQKSHYVLDNYYLSKQMRGIIKDANHDAIYMMHYFAKEADEELKCAVCQTEIGKITETTTLCKECDEKLDGQGVYN